MIRRLLICLRDLIDKILWKTSGYPRYAFSGNTALGCTCGIYLTSDNNNQYTLQNCTFSGNTDQGFWLSGNHNY